MRRATNTVSVQEIIRLSPLTTNTFFSVKHIMSNLYGQSEQIVTFLSPDKNSEMLQMNRLFPVKSFSLHLILVLTWTTHVAVPTVITDGWRS